MQHTVTDFCCCQTKYLRCLDNEDHIAQDIFGYTSFTQKVRALIYEEIIVTSLSARSHYIEGHKNNSLFILAIQFL